MTLNQNWSREGGESRTEEYRTWRTKLGFGAVCDVDSVEYRGRDGHPLLTIELCVADRRSDACPAGVAPGLTPSPAFFDQVVEKVSGERAQGRFRSYLTQALGVPFLLVVYIKGELEAGLWVRRMDSPSSSWEALTLEEYARRLRQMHARASERHR